MIGPREIATCTAKNSLSFAKLTVVKDAVPNDPQDFDFTAAIDNAVATPDTRFPANFKLDDDSDGTLLNQQSWDKLSPGTYVITEGSLPAGWTLEDIVLTGSGGTLTRDLVNRKATIVLAGNADATVTFKNTAFVALKLTKVVSGGGSLPVDWTMTAVGPAGAPGYSKPGNHTVFEPIWANAQYTLGETAPAGQADNYTAGAWRCDKGVTPNAQNQITVPAGTTDVTCTITNTRKAAALKLTKVVSGGGSLPVDWTMTAVGPAGAPGYSKPGNHTVFEPISAGLVYTLGEIAPAGQADNYTAGSWSCVNGTMNDAKTTVTVAAGEQATCTITNTRNTAQLLLVKKVSGGSSLPGAWTMTASDGGSGPDYSAAGDATAFVDVWASTAYTLGETGPANYTAGSWSCDSNVSVTDGRITLAKGAKVTCEITNTRDAAQLLLVKKVSGGTSVAGDWTMTATDGAAGPDYSATGDATAFVDVWAGTAYTLGESGPANYTAGSWSCDSEVTVVAGQITLIKGAKVTCEITNTRNTAELRLVKKVVGVDPADADEWDLSATGPQGAPIVQNEGGSGVLTEVWSGVDYQLAESDGPANYSPSAWVCEPAPVESVDEGVQALEAEVESGFVLEGNTITLDKGARVVCTITNTRDTA